MATRFLVEFELRGGGGGTRQVEGELRSLETRAGSTATAMRGLGIAFAALGGATAVVALVRRVVREASEAEDSLRRLNAMVEATGGKAGFSTQQLAQFAGQIQNTTRFSDEAVQAAETSLLRFTAIQGDIYKRALQAVVNIAAATGRDLEGVASAIGRSLEIPGEALRGLQQAGIILSDAQQRTLKVMVEGGRAEEARAAILRILESRYHGVAEAMAGGYAGAMDQAKNQASELMERVGGQGLTGAIEGLLRAFARWAQEDTTVQSVTILGKALVGLIHVIALVGNAVSLLPSFFLAAAGKIQTMWAGMIAGLLRGTSRFLGSLQFAGDDPIARGLARLSKPIQDLSGRLADGAKKAEQWGKSFTQFQADRFVGSLQGIASHAKAIGGLFGDAEQQVRRTGSAVEDLNSDLEGTPKAVKRTADEAARLAEQILSVVSALRREAEAAEGLFAATKRGPAAVREFEVAQARLNAALQLAGTGAIPAVVKLAEDYAERAVRARHATDDWAAAQEKVNAAIAAIPGWGDEPLIPLSAEAQAQIQWLLETARSIRGAGTSSRDIYRQEQEAIKQVVRTFPKLAEDGQAALNASTQRFWSEQLSHWGDAFDFLAARFGGFFTYLSDLVRGLQQAQQFGQSVSGMASGMGASAGTAAGLGALGGTAAIFAIVYDIVDKAIKDSKTRRFGDEGEFGIRGGVEGATWRGSTGGIGGRAQEVANAIRDAVRQFEDALGVSVDELETIGLKIRNDGKRVQAYIGGEFVGVFNNIQDAITEALRIAVMSGKAKLGGLTDLMAQGLGQWTAPDLDELVRFLGQLREIGDLGLSAEASGVRDAIRHLDGLWSALERLRVLTPAVQQGFDNLVAAEGRLWQNWIDSVTGREKSNAELLADKRAELVIIGHELALRRAVIQQRIIEVQATIAAIRAGNMLIGGGGGSGLGGGSGGSSGGILGVAKAFSVAGQIVAQTTVTVAAAGVFLSQAALDMIKALEAEAAALQGLLDSLPTLPDPSTIRIPGGSGSGVADLREEREAIDREIARFNLSDIGTQLADAQGWFDDMAERIREAFKGAEAAKRLTAAEDELARRRDEIAAAQRQASNEFLVRGTIWGGTLLTGLRDIGGESQRLQQNNRELAKSGQLTTREMRELNRQIREAAVAQRALLIQQTGTSLLADLYTFIGDEEAAAKLRYDLTVAELKIRYEELKIAAQIYGVVVTGMDEIGRIINNLPSYEDWRRLNGPQEPAGGSASTPAGNAAILRERAAREAEEWAERVRDAMATLVSFERRGMDPFLAEILEIQEAFADLRAVLGNTARVQSAYARAIADTIRQFLEPAREALAGLALSETSPLEAGERLMEAERQLRNAQLSFRSGDLAQMADAARRAPDLVQQLLRETQAALPVGSQAFRSMFRWANEVLSEIVAWGNQMTGDSGPDTASLGPGPLGLVNFDPVIAQLQMGQDATTLELIAIRRATQRTADATESTASQLAHTQIAAGTG